MCLLSIVAHARAFLLIWPQVHWISSTSFDDGVLLELIELDHLITKKKLEEVQPNKSCPFLSLILFCVTQGEDIKDFINPNSRKSSFATGEPAMRNLQHGTIIQLERKGFFRIDKAFVRAGQVFIPWRSTRSRCALGSALRLTILDAGHAAHRYSHGQVDVKRNHRLYSSPGHLNIVKFTSEINVVQIAILWAGITKQRLAATKPALSCVST